MTVTRWRYAARMRVARDLLASGAKPHTVARRVGYAHLPTFSTAFSRFHGLSPREYQERDAEDQEERLLAGSHGGWSTGCDRTIEGPWAGP